MAEFISHQEIIKQLKAISDKLQKGKLNQKELQTFQDLASNLYERAVVLNYKAKEEVFGEKKDAQQKSKKNKEEPIKSPEAEIDTPEEGVLFDFSTQTDETINEAKNEKTNKDNTDEKLDEEEKEKVSEVEKQESKDEAKEESGTDNTSVESPEIIEEEPQKEGKTTITSTRSTEIETDAAVYSFYERFTQVHDNSLGSILAAQKLSTLKGAIGLNDKLQFISELFNGDSSAFYETIETLDNLDSSESARIKLSEIAAKQEWNPEDELVEDFARLIERRYA